MVSAHTTAFSKLSISRSIPWFISSLSKAAPSPEQVEASTNPYWSPSQEGSRLEIPPSQHWPPSESHLRSSTNNIPDKGPEWHQNSSLSVGTTPHIRSSMLRPTNSDCSSTIPGGHTQSTKGTCLGHLALVSLGHCAAETHKMPPTKGHYFQDWEI